MAPSDTSTPGPSRPSPIVTANIDGSLSRLEPSSAPSGITNFPPSSETEALDVIPSRLGGKLCVRHKQMANQNVNRKLQKSLDNLPTNERSAVTQLWSTFSNSPHPKRKLILEGILTMCCFSQLSHLSDSLNSLIRIDPLPLLPREVNLRILGYLDAISLGRAAQVSKFWKALADDDLLWRRMCGQHIDRKCEKCGWGLPLLERRRLKVELQDGSPMVAVGVGAHDDHGHEHGHTATTILSRTEVLERKLSESMRNGLPGSMNGPDEESTKRPADDGLDDFHDLKRAKLGENAEILESGSLTRETRLTRPWKDVYCERLVVERNWRKNRCKMTSLKGHTGSIMCLQYHTTLSDPSFPVLITGSYDKTVRVWNLDTGTVIRTLEGHQRAVRALQFDQILLFTGSMDGTVRMWNWRAGTCLRVLEGHTDGVVTLNYNGYLLASGSADTTIQVWNFRAGNKFTLRGHDDWVNSVVLWDGKTSPGDLDPTLIPSFTRHRTSTSPIPRASEDCKLQGPQIDAGQMLFSASDDGTIKLWDLESQDCIRTFEGHKAQITSLRVLMVDMTADEVALASRRAAIKRALTPPHTNGSHFTSGSQALLTPSPPNQTVDIPDGFDPIAHRSGAQAEPRIFAHSNSEKEKSTGEDQIYTTKKALLTSGSLDGTIKLWDVDEGVETGTLFGHIEGVWAVDIDALRLASASHDRTIKVWDRESGQCVQTLVGHRGAVNALQLSDDMIVSGSDDGDVIVWSFAPEAGANRQLGTDSGL